MRNGRNFKKIYLHILLRYFRNKINLLLSVLAIIISGIILITTLMHKHNLHQLEVDQRNAFEEKIIKTFMKIDDSLLFLQKRIELISDVEKIRLILEETFRLRHNVLASVGYYSSEYPGYKLTRLGKTRLSDFEKKHIPNLPERITAIDNYNNLNIFIPIYSTYFKQSKRFLIYKLSLQSLKNILNINHKNQIQWIPNNKNKFSYNTIKINQDHNIHIQIPKTEFWTSYFQYYSLLLFVSIFFAFILLFAFGAINVWVYFQATNVRRKYISIIENKIKHDQMRYDAIQSDNKTLKKTTSSLNNKISIYSNILRDIEQYRQQQLVSICQIQELLKNTYDAETYLDTKEIRSLESTIDLKIMNLSDNTLTPVNINQTKFNLIIDEIIEYFEWDLLKNNTRLIFRNLIDSDYLIRTDPLCLKLVLLGILNRKLSRIFEYGEINYIIEHKKPNIEITLSSPHFVRSSSDLFKSKDPFDAILYAQSYLNKLSQDLGVTVIHDGYSSLKIIIDENHFAKNNTDVREDNVYNFPQKSFTPSNFDSAS